MYDIIIIGGGPAGLSAGLYAARSKKKTLIIEKGIEGGQIVETTNVENYPGIDSIAGVELGKKMAEQAKRFGAKIVMDEVVDIEPEGEVKKIKGYIDTYEAKAIIIATGASPREIGAPGEEEYRGRGVSYCSTCDAAFYEGETVYVVGGGDSAIQEALFITNFAKKVYIIHRRDELRATKALQEKAFNNEKIDFIWNSTVKEIKGDKIVTEMILKDTKTGEERSIKSDEPFGIFVFIGYTPKTEMFKGKIEITEDGYIKTDAEMRTNVKGVFAAGDIRKKSVRQVINAAGEGAVAAMNAQKYIDEEEGNLYEGFKESE